MSKLTIYKPNTLYNKNGRLFAFDAFIKCGYLYLIMPLYHNYPSSHDIHVFMKFGKITLQSNIIKYKGEPVHIMIYKIHSKVPNNQCAIIYNMRKFIIQDVWKEHNHLYQNCTLSLTTLCQHDYPLLQPFINYYVEQGVERFYIYYNEILTKEIQESIETICNKNNIELEKIVFIEWNFDYWNKNSMGTPHHAQLGQMHHAIYFFGKIYCDYMVFCDLDEYLYIKESKLNSFIKKHPNVDSFAFENIWAHNEQPNKEKKIISRKFEKKFHCSTKRAPYGWRSKCIHKIGSIQTINIHRHNTYLKPNCEIVKNQIMFHFYNWGQIHRTIDSIEKNVIFKQITLP